MSKTHVIADGITQVRMMLIHLYGEGNVFSVQALMEEDVTEGTKTLTASELQVKSLTDRAKQLNQQAKQTKARQSLEKAQKKLGKTVLHITN
jgi:phage shock protein A